jgi:hypothetical protein
MLFESLYTIYVLYASISTIIMWSARCYLQITTL